MTLGRAGAELFRRRGPSWRKGGRGRHSVVRGWDEVAEQLHSRRPRLVIADVDPAVAGWHADAQSLRRGFDTAEAALAPALPSACQLIWATNTTRVAQEFGIPPRHTPSGRRLIFGARKPLLHRLDQQVRSLPRAQDCVVVGDQWLTDGILAWRLGADFLQWEPTTPRPWIAKIKYGVGRSLVRPLWLRRHG